MREYEGFVMPEIRNDLNVDELGLCECANCHRVSCEKCLLSEFNCVKLAEFIRDNIR